MSIVIPIAMIDSALLNPLIVIGSIIGIATIFLLPKGSKPRKTAAVVVAVSILIAVNSRSQRDTIDDAKQLSATTTWATFLEPGHFSISLSIGYASQPVPPPTERAKAWAATTPDGISYIFIYNDISPAPVPSQRQFVDEITAYVQTQKSIAVRKILPSSRSGWPAVDVDCDINGCRSRILYVHTATRRYGVTRILPKDQVYTDDPVLKSFRVLEQNASSDSSSTTVPSTEAKGE